MFSVDDSFDLGEDDFLQAALDIEQTAELKNNGSKKRRSFDLGITSDEKSAGARLPCRTENLRGALGHQQNEPRISSGSASCIDSTSKFKHQTGNTAAFEGIENQPPKNDGAQLQTEESNSCRKNVNVACPVSDGQKVALTSECKPMLVTDVVCSRDGGLSNNTDWDEDDDLCDDVLSMVSSEMDSPLLPVADAKQTASNEKSCKISPALKPPTHTSEQHLSANQQQAVPSQSLRAHSANYKTIQSDVKLKSPLLPPSVPTTTPCVSHAALSPIQGHALRRATAACLSSSPVGNVSTPPTKRPSLSPDESSFSAHNPMKRKRKFPGPAGALPKLGHGRGLEDMNHVKPASPVVQKVTPSQMVVSEDGIPCSQNNEMFNDAPWLTLKRELEPNATQITQKFSVANIVKLATLRQLPRGKVPVACVLIDGLTIQNADASVFLKDESGGMQGTLHRQLLKEYAMSLQIGTALVLRQVGVFSPTGRKHYLNITPNNLVRIYCKNVEGELSCNKIGDFTMDDFTIPPVESAPVSPQLRAAVDKFGPRTPQQSALFSEGGTPVRPPPSVNSGWGNQRHSSPNSYNRTATPNAYARSTTPSACNRPSVHNTYNRQTAPNIHNRPHGHIQNSNQVRTPFVPTSGIGPRTPVPSPNFRQQTPRPNVQTFKAPATSIQRTPLASAGPNIRTSGSQLRTPQGVLVTSTTHQTQPNTTVNTVSGQTTCQDVNMQTLTTSHHPTHQCESNNNIQPHSADGKFVFRRADSSANQSRPLHAATIHQTAVTSTAGSSDLSKGVLNLWQDENDDQLDTLLQGLEDEMSQPH